jgi:mannose-6-phosphate isomerase-like protein (cupin superfamily)
MSNIINWRNINKIEDGCGGVIYKILDTENSELKQVEMVMCIFKPGEIARLHFHNRMEEIYFVIEGVGKIELDGKWFDVKPEDSISIPVGVRHRMRNASSDKILRFLAINSPEWIATDMIEVKD